MLVNGPIRGPLLEVQIASPSKGQFRKDSQTWVYFFDQQFLLYEFIIKTLLWLYTKIINSRQTSQYCEHIENMLKMRVSPQSLSKFPWRSSQNLTFVWNHKNNQSSTEKN
jgi:hypothetical protein